MVEWITSCPSCGAHDLEDVYEARGIPIHSCLLMASRQEALAHPTGDLAIGWCRACGFSCNRAFDPTAIDYSTQYEESQTFSPTFKAFSAELVERLIGTYDLRGKEVVEIGCGKGEFLMELCERGGNRGVGIDPAYVPGRGQWEAGERAHFLNELYSDQRHGGFGQDAIVCRHTLEHIAPTREFLRTVRRGIGSREDTLVFFELPDVERIYDERAFWDVYYEHCSYFTAGSLERLFLACGFEVLDSRKGYGDQYLLIEARPRPADAEPEFRVREDLAELGAKVKAFAVDVPRAIEGWRSLIRKEHREGRRVAIWGAGSKGVAFLTSVGLREEVDYAIDINPNKHGFFLPGTGHEVIMPASLCERPPDLVVIMNGIYQREIAEQLGEMGLTPHLLAL